MTQLDRAGRAFPVNALGHIEQPLASLYVVDACSGVSYGDKATCCTSTKRPVLGGIDIVAFRDLKATMPPIVGKLEFAAGLPTVSGNYVFFFANVENRDAFVADPWSFTPSWGGFCGYSLATNDLIKGVSAKKSLGPPVNLLNWELNSDGKLCFFADDSAQGEFDDGNWRHIAQEADRKWKLWFGNDLGTFNTQCLQGYDYSDLLAAQEAYVDYQPGTQLSKSVLNVDREKEAEKEAKQAERDSKTSEKAEKQEAHDTKTTAKDEKETSKEDKSKEKGEKGAGGKGGGGGGESGGSHGFSVSEEMTDKERRQGISAGEMYYVHYGMGNIERIQLEEGTGNGFHMDVMLSGLKGRMPKDVRLDLENSHMYWTDLYNGTVTRCPMGGVASLDECDVLVTGMAKSALLELDYENRMMYWTGMKCIECEDEFRIFRTSMDEPTGLEAYQASLIANLFAQEGSDDEEEDRSLQDAPSTPSLRGVEEAAEAAKEGSEGVRKLLTTMSEEEARRAEAGVGAMLDEHREELHRILTEEGPEEAEKAARSMLGVEAVMQGTGIGDRRIETVVELKGQSMGMGVYGGQLFYTDYYESTLSSVSLGAITDTSTPEPISTELNGPKYVDIKGDYMYWVDEAATAIKMANLADYMETGVFEPHLLLGKLAIVNSLRVLGDTVYWSDKNGYIYAMDKPTLLELAEEDRWYDEGQEPFLTVVDGLLKPKGIEVYDWPAPAGLTFTTSTKYTERGDPPVFANYTWAPGPVVEPYMPTTLKVAEKQEGRTYEWEWNGHLYPYSGIKVTTKSVGERPLVLRERDVETGDITRELRTALTSKYVRREIRDLLEEDRLAFLDAMKVMVVTPMEEGVQIYGPNYRDMSYFVALHNNGGGNECDHMHNGMGFLTQHLGLTLELEQALQVVDPAVTVPYWDFTVDGHHIYNEHDGDFDYLWNSVIFDPDWFGTQDEETHSIEEGRWAGILKVDQDQWYQPVHNAYGMMRAPWNNNNYPYIQRFRSLAGVPVWNVHEGWPTCEYHHYAITAYNAWLQFAFKVAAEPHGSIHAILGGTFHSEHVYDKLEDFMSAEDVFTLRAHSYNTPKNLWRRGLMECPTHCDMDTPMEECICNCGEEEDLMERLSDPDMLDEFYVAAAAGKNKLSGEYTDDEKKKFISIMCRAGTAIGDQLESASPADVVFWPIHPTIERLAQWRMMRAGFSDEDWPEEGNYRGTVKIDAEQACTGHGPNDLLPWQLNMDDGDDYKKQYTNLQMYTAINPTQANFSLPFVYDQFKWDHCVEEGYDFNI
eukprot:CAMPEP_0113952822 /NCGR_PEP_ID=MMETSP1339-20121228/90638_1 /TAXON_ID=94617 /ORGANISM="Fibrocapsa japonica" /LENGTH=1284 /DNA_ID=CAMNT_0000961487 /DNA_START=143 /DNA_END=3997 /DNA_ORIENTATION=- /assembly_acc=CAM_ASM_000762